MKLNILL